VSRRQWSIPHLEQVPAPHVLAACLCIGLGLSLVLREGRLGLALAALALAGLALVVDDLRLPLLAAALLVAGAWWGGVRLEALDSSELADEIGRAALVRIRSPGPRAAASSRCASRFG